MDSSFHFQSLIFSLQRFWAEHGCLLWQPYYSQVGAGTMNPATFLRVLGPEPWNVAYVEPSIRPDDGRYGDNPYRMQQHYQFQVILKPEPGNPQELYLQSLQALGIDPRQHDIRFVEDNWEQPALGAWGLGWEVWLDGQEITQFTYFQQAGGINLDPVSVEMTYGLERLAMPLQGRYHFRELQWNDDLTYGEVNLQGEREHSRYYFEVADVERLREMFALYEKEAQSSLEKELVLPAYDYILKCSHTFNVLDTRGAIGVTERQALFSRMRDLARRVSEAYLNQRQALGFPWLKKTDKVKTSAPKPAPIPEKKSLPKNPQTLLVEVGTEELPANDLHSALEQLKAALPECFSGLRLEHGEIKVLGTPRRQVFTVEKLAPKQTDSTQIIKGPPAKAAVDANGKFTPTAEGFARSKGISVKELKVQRMDGGEYVVAEIHQPGRSVFEVLPAELTRLIANLRFEKTMRWNASNVAFSRPMRWLLAMYGEQVVPMEYAGVQSGNLTRGLRFLEPEIHMVKNAEDYFDFLSGQKLLVDQTYRSAMIQQQVKKLMQSASGEPSLDLSLVDEVNALVEAPHALLGSFDKVHLELPEEVLASVMKKYQRCVPVKDKKESLLPRFIAVRNGDGEHLDKVAHGNEQVIQARFADAKFFMDEDLQYTIEDFLPRLKTLVFHLKLGSMLEKSERVQTLVEAFSKPLGLSEKEANTARRAAQLCKADLVSSMVVEMTSLQGVMGRIYALRSGEEPAVAQAIEEHYYPRFSGDVSPSSRAGLAVGIADRLDSLVGLFAVGMAPSGARDPYGLRRAAIGIIQNLINWKADYDLQQGIELCARTLKEVVTVETQIQEECLAFISGRLENYLLDEGYRYDVVAAVFADQGFNPYAAYGAVQQLQKWVQRTDWSTILPAYARCVRITRDQASIFEVDSNLLSEPAEKELHQAVESVLAGLPASSHPDDFLNTFLPLIPKINTFFDKVLVMDEDQRKQKNRLGLLQKIAGMARGKADLSKLEGF
jgi:glycyl-tRNA synthetase